MEESTQKMALRVLKAINKSSVSSLQLDDVPTECCRGIHIDFHRWSLIVSDETLKRLSSQTTKEPFHFLDCAGADVPSMFTNFRSAINCKDGIISFNIVGAKDVTEYGLAMIARRNPNLRHLDISGCTKISDPGLREVGLSCLNLEALMMAGCHAFQGSGLVAIADNCKFLRKLNFSRCRGIESWSIKKLFYKCLKLEEVYVNNLSVLGDEELRVLAQSCPNMLVLEAKECQYVSDQSILALSQNCPDIDFIDVSRTQMTFRISDVSLLALGQRSASLRVLRLNGCDQISDVGLTWLAEGCKALEELDVGGCTKITDAGLRSIGSSCHVLTALDISINKLISDIGLTSISSGCPKLRKLMCPGLYLLADPRLSAPRKGEPLEAWQAVVGLAAVAKFCPMIDHINLAGCFRLNVALEQYVASMGCLITLNLTGCNQCSTQALERVAMGCPKIEDLTLSDCGKAVNNASIAAFAKSCRNLKCLVLARCDGLRGGAMKAIATLDALEKLDLSGCKSLTDMMILPICEVDRVPKLRFLSLSSNKLITDTTIAWLASKDQVILLLALKGTSVTRHGIRAVKDYFPFSDLLDNENFFGFWPKARVEDKKLINKYYTLVNGITKLQARMRASTSKQRVVAMMVTRRRDLAVLVIQRTIRTYLAKVKTYHRRREVERFERSAKVIANFMRIPRAKKRVERIRVLKRHRLENRVAIKLQVAWRMYVAKGLLMYKIDAKRRHITRREFCATKIQSIARVYFAKNYIKRIKAMRQARVALEERKAGVVQRAYRGKCGRKVAELARRERFRISILLDISAAKIQKCAKAFKFRKEIRRRIALRKLRWENSIKIQSVIRGALARIYVYELAVDRDERVQFAAAVKIQGRWRVKQAWIQFREMVKEQAELLRRRNAAALVLQTQYRSLLARRILWKLQEEHEDMIRRQVQLRLDSATKIQAFFRGTRGRIKFEEALRQKKGKWRELFDEDKKRRFFYNKITGEIRWRMPQDLLDLIPRPTCDNCVFYEGCFECEVCNEIFCNQCFEQVHHGGRRKDHDFRSLYDYYGKRIDYGDGVFPCKWPSEVMQDETQGWMLRVAPIRDPVSVQGDWEEYQEIELSGAPGKTFYFNRSTFEATYDMPTELSAPATTYATGGEHDPQYAHAYGGYQDGYDSSGYYHGATEGHSQSGNSDSYYYGGDSSGGGQGGQYYDDGQHHDGQYHDAQQYYAGSFDAQYDPAAAGDVYRSLGYGPTSARQQHELYALASGRDPPPPAGPPPQSDRSGRRGGGWGNSGSTDPMRSVGPSYNERPVPAKSVLDTAYEIGVKSARGSQTQRGALSDKPAVPTGQSAKKKPALTGKLFHKAE